MRFKFTLPVDRYKPRTVKLIACACADGDIGVSLSDKIMALAAMRQSGSDLSPGISCITTARPSSNPRHDDDRTRF